MRPRVFLSSEKALARACADLRRASACATLEPQRRLNRFACSLAILALVWAGTTGAGTYWHYLMAHGISAARWIMRFGSLRVRRGRLASSATSLCQAASK
jgi:hypothetical protein